MHYNRTQITALKSLTKKDYLSITQLAQDLSISPATADLIVHDLEHKGIVDLVRSNRRINIRFNNNKHTLALKRMFSLNAHVDYGRILSNEKIDLMKEMVKSTKDKKELAEILKVSSRTVERNLSPLMELGVVLKQGRRYAMNPQWGDIISFLREYFEYINNAQVGPGCVMYWQNLDEFLVQSDEPIDKKTFHLTGAKALCDYGVSLLTEDTWDYYYSEAPTNISLEEVCIHMQVKDTFATRPILYTTLAILKNRDQWNWDRTLAISRGYGLEKRFQELRRFIESEGAMRGEGFPDWSEVMKKAKEYDIDG